MQEICIGAKFCAICDYHAVGHLHKKLGNLNAAVLNFFSFFLWIWFDLPENLVWLSELWICDDLGYYENNIQSRNLCGNCVKMLDLQEIFRFSLKNYL